MSAAGMCPLGLSRFNALDLSESPPPPPGEEPLFFDSHVSAVNVSVPLIRQLLIRQRSSDPAGWGVGNWAF